MKYIRPKRNETVTVTCTEEEKDKIFFMAHEAGLTVSAYIRMLINQQASAARENNGEL